MSSHCEITMDKHSTPDETGVVQAFGALAPVRIGLHEQVRAQSVRANELQSWFIVQHLGLRAEQG